MTATATEVRCPKCGGPTWDNRASKKNPKAPDYKCRDKSCDGAVWPPRNGVGTPATKQAVSLGGPMPWETEAEAAQVAPPAPVANVPADRFTPLAQLYTKCLLHVLTQVAPALIKAEVGTTPEAIVAATATLFIQANQRGLV